MPTNQTPNYKLNQWVRSDRILMEDFNADNAKIDAALKAETDARTAADAGLSQTLAKLGNCRIYSADYTGDGTYGSANQTRVTFPKKPLVVFLYNLRDGLLMSATYGQTRCVAHGSESYPVTCNWSTTSLSFYSNTASGQMNALQAPHRMIALIAADE